MALDSAELDATYNPAMVTVLIATSWPPATPAGTTLPLTIAKVALGAAAPAHGAASLTLFDGLTLEPPSTGVHGTIAQPTSVAAKGQG